MREIKMNVKVILTLCLVIMGLIVGIRQIDAADESTIKFEEALITGVKTGTAAMDDNDNPGYDSSESNDIVRSFDTIAYPLNLNLSSIDGKTYTDIKVKIIGEVENGVTSDGRILNALFDTAFNGKYDLDAKTSTIEYTIPNIKTG